MSVARLIVIAAMLVACQGDVTVAGGGGAGGEAESGGDSASAGAAPTAGTANPGPVCPASGACLEENGCLVTSVDFECRTFECDLPSPCEEVDFSSSDPWGLDGPFTLETPEPLACLLAALSAGTEGSYRWRSRGLRNPNGYGIFHTVHVHAGRVAIGSRDSAGDLGTLRDTVGPVALREPSYFDDCAALSSGAAIWGCLEGWALGCASR